MVRPTVLKALRLLAVCLFSQLAAAQTTSSGSTPTQKLPKKIAGTYRHAGWCVENFGAGIQDMDKWTDCKKSPVNTLSIQELESGEYAVWFEFTGFATTPSYCRFSGLFQLNENTLELVEPYENLGCKMKIKVSDDKFVFEDPDRSCHENFCSGTNQSINMYEFPRKGDIRRKK